LFGSRIFPEYFQEEGGIKIKINFFSLAIFIPELTSGFFDVGGKNKIKYFLNKVYISHCNTTTATEMP
jgi:hypothetical protein